MPTVLMILGGLAVGSLAYRSIADTTVKIVIIGGVAYFVAKKAGVI